MKQPDKTQKVLDKLGNAKTPRMKQIEIEVQELTSEYNTLAAKERRRVMREELAAARERGVRQFLSGIP